MINFTVVATSRKPTLENMFLIDKITSTKEETHTKTSFLEGVMLILWIKNITTPPSDDVIKGTGVSALTGDWKHFTTKSQSCCMFATRATETESDLNLNRSEPSLHHSFRRTFFTVYPSVPAVKAGQTVCVSLCQCCC